MKYIVNISSAMNQWLVRHALCLDSWPVSNMHMLMISELLWRHVVLFESSHSGMVLRYSVHNVTKPFHACHTYKLLYSLKHIMTHVQV